MFQQHLPIFHKSRPSAGVVPTPMALSDLWFIQNFEIIKNWGGQNVGGGQKIIWGGGICPLTQAYLAHAQTNFPAALNNPLKVTKLLTGVLCN